MLLHKSYINMAIANILSLPRSLYDLQKRRKYFRLSRERAWSFGQFPHPGKIVSWAKFVLLTLKIIRAKGKKGIPICRYFMLSHLTNVVYLVFSSL